MICSDCQLAATFNPVDEEAAKEMHEKCEGDCGCQHKTGPGWFVRRNEKAPLIQVQSP